MTTLTIRIDEKLKSQAAKQAEKLGIPLTLVVKTALKDFIDSPRLTIGEPETVEVNLGIQKKMDKVAKLLAKK